MHVRTIRSTDDSLQCSMFTIVSVYREYGLFVSLLYGKYLLKKKKIHNNLKYKNILKVDQCTVARVYDTSINIAAQCTLSCYLESYGITYTASFSIGFVGKS